MSAGKPSQSDSEASKRDSTTSTHPDSNYPQEFSQARNAELLGNNSREIRATYPAVVDRLRSGDHAEAVTLDR